MYEYGPPPHLSIFRRLCIWQHELYQQIHSSNVSRPSHLCICQYIQHPLSLLVECRIPSSRCGRICLNVILPIFIAQSVRIPLNNIISLQPLLVFLLHTVKNLFLCINLFRAPNSYAPNALTTSSIFFPLCQPNKILVFKLLFCSRNQPK